MIPIRGTHYALLRAEKRITEGLAKRWNDSFDDKAMDSVRTGLYSSYIFGKIAMTANLLKYGKKPKTRFSSIPFLEIVSFVLSQDKDILKRLTVNPRIPRPEN